MFNKIIKELKTGIIYEAKNAITGKSYVGQTTTSLKLRIKRHYNHSKRDDNHFARALRKYAKKDWGVVNFA